MQQAAALPRASLADGEQAGDPRPGRSIGRIEDETPTAGQIDARARDRADSRRLLRLPGADNAGDGADVGDADRRITTV
jgi:hypothetical protein